MAQQTQVARVVPKWQQFMQRWPTPGDCAKAPLADVLRLWSGLGYPRRCRNLHLAARAVVERHDGVVPNDLASLLALPGVGPYTARAVLAFADSTDVAVVDTNVARVLARVAGTSLSARASQELADATLPKGRAWEWNQVLIDFGAQVCTARNPRCSECAIAGGCRTYATFGTSWNADADPARTSALTSKPQARFDGSDRQARGRLMKMLTTSGVRVADVASVMKLGDDDRRAWRLVQSLERDGLVVVDGEWCRLP
ncbi:MAG: A/G-specific adenine glycosylase [Actinobacteria bacterium]|nr:A/G-specific adenine glycosylase [Actinomycetota bacterium]